MPKKTFFNLDDDKREAIKQVAIDEFSSRTFNEASLSRIVARLGIAKGSMYQYFKNKLDLFAWLAFEEAGRLKMKYLSADILDPDPDDIFEFIHASLIAGFTFTREHPRVARLALRIMDPGSGAELDALSRAHRERGQAYIRMLLTRAQARGQVRDDISMDVLVHFTHRLLGQDILDLMLLALDTDMASFLADPQIAKRLDEQTCHAISDDIIALLRGGIAAPASSKPDEEE